MSLPSTALAGVHPTQLHVRTDGLRVLPRPVCEPPYDDELERPADVAETQAAQVALPLTFTVGRAVPAVPRPPAQLRLLDSPGPRTLPAAEVEAASTRRPTARAALPDPRSWTARLTQALVEVLAGVRPLPQLAPWVSEGVYADLAPRVRAADRRGQRRRPPAGAQLRTLRVCEPADGVAEASAVVQYGARCRAFALRLEGLDGRWRCTALQLV